MNWGDFFIGVLLGAVICFIAVDLSVLTPQGRLLEDCEKRYNVRECRFVTMPVLASGLGDYDAKAE